MAQIEIVTTADRHDLDDQARAALRGVWPEFIFHDPLVAEYLERVEAYFPRYVVPDALDLVRMDRAADRGTYAETNLWMRHR